MKMMKMRSVLQRLMKRSAVLLAVATCGVGTVRAASGNWNVTTAGNWSTLGNWSPAAVPGTEAGDIIGLTYNIAGARTITIDTTSRTNGVLNIGDPSSTFAAYTLAASGGATLTFDNGLSNAQINKPANLNSVTDIISAPLVLNSSLDIAISSVANGKLTIQTGGITAGTAGTKTISNNGSGAGGVTISGAIGDGSGVIAVTQNSATSVLTLSGANTYTGDTTIKAGTLTVNGASAAINSPEATINIGTEGAGTLAFTLGAITVKTLLATNVVSGGATNSTFTFTGGTLVTSNANDIAAHILVASNAAFNVTGNWAMNGGTHRIASVQTNGTWGTLTFGYNASFSTIGKAYSVNTNAVLSLGNPDDAGSMNLTLGYRGNSNSLIVDGGLVTNVGTLTLAVSQGSCYNQLLIKNGGRVFSGQGGSSGASVSGSSNPNNTNNVTVTGSGSLWDLGGKALTCGGGNGTTAIGNSLLVDGGGVVTNVSQVFLRSQLSSITIANGSQLFSSGNSDIGGWTGNHNNRVYVGSTTGDKSVWNHGGSTLSIGYSGATNNSLTVAAGGILTNAAITLSGGDSVFNLSGDAYISKVNLSVGSARMNFTGGGVLHATANGSLLYGAGTNMFSGSNGSVDTAGFSVTNAVVNAGDGGLTKLGEGTLVLSGTNTYTGATVVQAGKLSLMQPMALSSASTLEVKPGASVDLNYIGTNTIYSLTVNGEIKTRGVFNAAAVGGIGEGYLQTVYPPPKGTIIRLL